MIFWLGVENFAKIESARVCINKYTVLVGQNNSGKTYLMQLIQGVCDLLVRYIDNDIFEIVLAEKENGQVYTISKDNIERVVQYINSKLDENKAKIIKEIFGKDIEIGKLYIEVEYNEESKYIMKIMNKDDNRIAEMKDELSSDYSFLLDLLSRATDEAIVGVLVHNTLNESKIISIDIHLNGESIFIIKSLLKHIFDIKSLFLPSSRTGLLVLYREFFANKTDSAISYKIENGEGIKDKEMYGGLTQPMYEYLRFLQTYTESDSAKTLYKEELTFFQDRLIDGHINISKQGKMSYSSKIDNLEVPMHLASSMINELTPILLAITGRERYSRLIIDEVESSLHPEKQMELALFFNRLRRKGVQLIVSTHSDSFVSKLNNIYNMSKIIEKKAHKNDKSFDTSDMLLDEEIYVYEFKIQKNGKSAVKEIIPDENGYFFELFTEQTLKLYEEAKRIGEEAID